MEFVWKPSGGNNRTQIFTHVLNNHYGEPDGFDFDPYSGQQPGWQDREFKLTDAHLLDIDLQKRRKAYKTNDLFVLFGNDFRYRNASENFRHLDRMITFMNTHSGYNFKYSTPEQYIDAIARKNIVWPTKYDDLFPYADHEDSYWSGYFTSRPNLKSLIK